MILPVKLLASNLIHCQTKIFMKKKEAGFSLIEMAIVLIIISLLLGTMLMPLSEQQDIRRIKNTQFILEQAKNALIGYAMLNNGSLPCPAATDDGLKETKPCPNNEGYLPWADLGVNRRDSWGNPIRYRADNNYTGDLLFPNDATIDMETDNTAGTKLVVRPIDTALPVLTPEDANNRSQVLAILFSCGKNGKPDNGNNASGSNNCVNSNTPPNANYVQDYATPAANFDDILIWLPKNSFIPQMVSAGVWPL